MSQRDLPPVRQVRGSFVERTIRVYQAYPPRIASMAVAAQGFKPPFNRKRMTWIKPSFAWMMYRSGWGTKQGQERILAIDILRDGFEWALAHSSLSGFDRTVHQSLEEWESILDSSPVRVQWDPERTLKLEPLAWRTIQVGLGGNAVDSYVDEWVVGIEDVTALAKQIQVLVARGELEAVEALRPSEKPYPLPMSVAERIGVAVHRFKCGTNAQ